MCGIGGYVTRKANAGTSQNVLRQMLSRQQHRGPDGLGFHEELGFGLGHARLSIVGLDNGRQPIANEDETVWLALNGEIFNHHHLREQLVSKGHRFRTQSDSEVVLHLYEDQGMDFLDLINGQFSFALWDRKTREAILCRDRHGILPLFYTQTPEAWVFASELKSIVEHPGVPTSLDLRTLDQIFTFWAPLPPRTMLKNVFQVRPGSFVRIRDDRISETQYWDLEFLASDDLPEVSEQNARQTLAELFQDAVDLRRQADVPVGCYLSGGLDSSAVTVTAAQLMGCSPEAFSIRFADPDYDEREHQGVLARHCGIDASSIEFTAADLIRRLPSATYHAEQPVMRTGMVPMLMLSELVHKNNFKAVLAGEGADEFLLGYNIFKEAKVRRFWSREPESSQRPRLLERLYPYLAAGRNAAHWQGFFRRGLEDTNDRLYSHRQRWTATARCKRFFSDDIKSELNSYDADQDFESQLPADYVRWCPMGQAQYIEATLFLNQYLLSAQGDRMAMANAVEVRYPFLDHRIVEFCNQLPARWKMRGLNEKRLLKQAMQHRLPASIVQRPKQPYRAPSVEYREADAIWDVLSTSSIERANLFNPKLVQLLLQKLSANAQMWSESDQMALTGIVTTQLFHTQFIDKQEIDFG